MNEASKSPFTVVKSEQSTPVPMNGKPWTQPNVEAAGLTDEEADLQREEQLLQEKREQIRLKREQEATEARNALLLKRDKAKGAAQNFRQEALKATSEADKRSLYEWATEADHEAAMIEAELGIVSKAAQVAPEKQPFLLRNKGIMALLQVLGVILAIIYFHGLFEGFGLDIAADNLKLPIEKQLQPYDATSIQKLFYEKLVVFVDLPIALLILFLVSPFVGFYVLPFVKSKKDFYTEFYEDLTPWQRTCITTAVCLGLLFFLALSHNVKP
ncbi:PRKR-interacting protein 1 [Spirosoma endbachense]|uniref:Uncharacterized protein n=1 Tax=Spirosoma endbachense TaxID=2666025 RepID=A0A6P1W1T1_9BACT|nr:PRKR-interacting protein 1 [Spirosoma endbachense]QHV97949.1 hypothetical protein GJR95_24365 [Spirosoma endbachense]